MRPRACSSFISPLRGTSSFRTWHVRRVRLLQSTAIDLPQTRSHVLGVSDNAHYAPKGPVLGLRRMVQRRWLHVDVTPEDGLNSQRNVEAEEFSPKLNRADLDPTKDCNNAYLGIGSNVGNRIEAIEAACHAIDDSGDMRILQTSPLYETEPMYVQDQDRFLNGVCEIETQLGPIDLLDRLQAIEQQLGRVKTVDKGPRNIDLDILLFKGQEVRTDRLIIPHPLMHERGFVLKPLRDVFSGRLWPSGKTAEEYLAELIGRTDPMFTYTPLGTPDAAIQATNPIRATRVMSILNVTPDSFSDGGVNEPSNEEALKATILRHISEGSSIIDIGGQSSRPNAPEISAEEEISRVLPAIKIIRSLPEAENVAISVDTYRAAVAEAAVDAGAHIINDISAGLLDPDMLKTVAKLGCTYIMMHMRGTPATMQNEQNTSYPDGLIPTIARELSERLVAAQEAGIRRWRIILDPGVGFSKTQAQNLEILRKLSVLIKWPGLQNLPWLVGSSRKGFIGKITGVEVAAERVMGTAATVTAAIQGGADIVRIHDVKEMAQVVKMADALYRR